MQTRRNKVKIHTSKSKQILVKTSQRGSYYSAASTILSQGRSMMFQVTVSECQALIHSQDFKACSIQIINPCNVDQNLIGPSAHQMRAWLNSLFGG